MLTQEQIAVVLNHPVYDAEGNKVGDARHVFFDDITGRPDWVTVRTGLFGTKETFVPTQEATVVEDHLEVPYPKSRIKDAPNVDVDAGGHLSRADEDRLFEYYGLGGGRSATTAATGAGTETGAGPETATQEPGTVEEAGGDAMTRSEEQLHVGTERREVGRARLRKYVVTEEVQRTVPVTREEVRIEREPITDANRDAAMTGPDISEAEHEVTLHEERPVMETETVPVEQVRMTTEERTGEETVRGEVRKEKIGVEVSDRDADRDAGRSGRDEGRER
ncbi:DUF2382 domain-containing protein [Streptomyces sclerotialus]|uniref:DUF2382 domain-containing protein n=1 Tax=Streptomyces sclerotialus TaxID=1957 RepID=UPI0004C64B27